MRKILLSISLLLVVFVQSFGQNQSSLLWEISGNGLQKKSYLYGTMHVSNKIAFHLGDTFFMALDGAELVCLESDPGKWIEEMYESESSLLKSRFDDYYDLGSDNFYENLVSVDAPEKKDLENALRQKHSLENGFLYRGSEYNDEYEENTYLDLFIYQYARKNKIDVLNLEDFEETNKLQVLSMLPDDEEEDDKKKKKKTYYSKWNKEMSIREAMEDAYRNGKLEIIDSITRMTARSDNYLHYFLHERNRIMAEGIDTLAQQKSIFIGIGAAHLPGDKGVIEMLKQKGYTMRPVMRNKSLLAKEKKNAIEKKFLDLPYKSFTTKDGYITVNLPGKLYETKGQSKDLQYFYPDMANGGNFFISRFQTYSPIHNKSVDYWKLKVDSLLFENVEGKIIEQKHTKVSGFDAIKILNETRKGDFQRRLIVFTPLEIIFFKMAGTGEWAKIYGDRFINSVQINQSKDKPTVYTSHLNDFQITFPSAIINTVHAVDLTNSPPKYDVQSYLNNDSSYFILQSDWLTDFGYIEEDTFELNYLFKVFAEQFDSLKVVKTISSNESSANGIVVTNEGDSIYLQSNIWKNFYYLLIAKSDYPKAQKFFNSLKFTNDYLEDEYVVYHDTVLKYTVTTPVTPPEMEDLLNYVRRKSSEDKKDEWDYVKHYRDFFYNRNYESIKVKYLKHSDYYHFKSMKDFWEDELEDYLKGGYIITKEEYDNKSSTPTSTIIVSDTGSQKVIEVKTIVNKGVVYTIRAAYNGAQPKSKFISTFFETFKPDMDSLLGKEITVSNAPLFFADLASGDSISIERAVNLSNRIKFTKDHVDSMIWYIKNYEFPENDKKGTANYLTQQLGYIKHPAILPFLKERYEESTDNYEAQFSVLKALAKYGTKKSYKLMDKLLIQEPPITRNENPIESFFYYLDDSLSLTSKLYPDLWDLMLYTDYRESVYELSAKLLDSNLIKSSSYKREKPLILREAKASTTTKKTRRRKSDYSSTVKLKDTDFIYSFGKKKEYPISTIDQYTLTQYLKLLMPYYKKDKKVFNYVNSLLSHEDKDYQFVATIMMTKYNLPVHDSLYLSLSKNPDYRFAFYKALKFIGKESKFDQNYLSQEQLMESAIHASSLIDVADSVKFVEKRYIKNKYDEGYVYFFKHQSDYNNKWYVHYAGLQPKDTSQISHKTYLDYIERKASSVYTEAEIKSEIDDWVKYLNLIGRERAASKSSSDYSFYD